MTYLGIMFDDEKHTYDDFGLRIKSINIGMPEVKESKIELPGTDGVLDMTDYFGTRYDNRVITVECDLEDKSYQNFAGNISRLSNYLHGKKRKISLDWDEGYYYVGRGECEFDKDNRTYCKIELRFDCEPYKYEATSSDEDWLWNPLDLDDGVIREYNEIAVSGNTSVVLIGSPMPVVPRFIVSADMTVTFDGETYELKSGENYIPDIEIREGEQTMVFSGNGTVSISYRGGSL